MLKVCYITVLPGHDDSFDTFLLFFFFFQNHQILFGFGILFLLAVSFNNFNKLIKACFSVN